MTNTTAKATTASIQSHQFNHIKKREILMKLQTILLGCLVSVCSISYADTTLNKVKFIKKVYADQLNDDLISIDIVKLHAGKELRRLIDQRDAIADEHLGDMCSWVGEGNVIPGNDFDVKLHQMKFSVLNNGRVRAQGKNFGENFHVDFEVQCQGESCTIADVYDPNSLKKTLTKVVQQRLC